MDSITEFCQNYFLGGDRPFMTGWHCLNGHYYWGWITIILCMLVIASYLKIAYHWYTNLKTLRKGLPKSSLFTMMNIFVFCAVCGYTFPILFMWYPVYPIRAFFLLVLFVFSATYAMNTPKMRVIYEEIHTAGKLTEDLEKHKKIAAEAKGRAENAINPIDNMATEMLTLIDNNPVDGYKKEDIVQLKSHLGQLEQVVNEIRRTLSRVDV